MSNRTNQPLPVIGAQNWGSTLNNYLRNQEYGRLELEQDLSDLYAQQSTVVQTVLSSGVMDKSVSGKKPGLYDNAGTFIGEGAKLDFTKKYYYRGYAAVLGSTTINSLIGGGEGGLEIVSPALTEAVDARCTYAHYDISNNSWSLKFGDTETPSTETSISLNPYYICIGVIVKINSNYYWHYKTMKSNLSISSKKWMLDEPHASLSTYMFMNCGRIGVYYDNDSQLSGVLTTQALGINPFTSTETITNELGGDLRTTTIASKAGGYNFSVLLIKSTTSGTNTTYGTTFYADGNSVLPLNSNKYYRLSATSILIEGKVLFLMQEEISSSSVDRTIFSNESFNRLWYYSDPVELYRIKGSTMTASPGNGLSPINANGIDPHVTTLIKDSDEVWFGKDNNHKFRFDNTGIDDEFKVVMTVPKNQGDTSMLLTNNMIAIPQTIKIQNSLFPLTAGGNNVDNYIKMYRGDSAANYHNITLATKQGNEGAYAHFTGQGYIKLGAYEGNDTFNVDSGTPDANIYIKSKNRGTADNDSNIQLKADYIDNYANHITEVTEDWQVNYGGSDPRAYFAIQYRDNRSLFSLGVDSSKTITMTTDGEATEKPCIQVGGGCKLSSDGLTLPSVNSGVKIGTVSGITGPGTVDSAPVITLSDPDAEVYKGHPSGWAQANLPALTVETSDRVISPWSEFDPDANIKDQITKVIVTMLLPGGGEQTYECPLTNAGKFYYHDNSSMGSNDTKIEVEFLSYTTTVKWTPENKFDKPVKVEAPISLTFLKQPIITLGDVRTAVLHIKSLGLNAGEDVVLHIPTNGSRGHIYVEDSNNSIVVDDNSGHITVGNNSDRITINKANSTSDVSIQEYSGDITLNNKFHIHGNICYYDDSAITYSSVLSTVSNMGIVASNPNTLWRIYGFAEEKNCVNGEGKWGAAAMLSRGFGNEDNKTYTYYTFLPDIGRYTAQFEIYDAMDGIGVPEGNLISFRTATWDLYTAENNVSTTLLTKGDYPGLAVAAYLEEDRICVKLVIDANINISGSVSAWGFRVAFIRDWDTDHKYYVAPVCRIK